jgi:hypothetical protein
VEKNQSYKDHIEEQIVKQINEKLNPLKDSKLPWEKDEKLTSNPPVA